MLDSGLVNHGTGTYRNMVTFGEDPAVEVWGHVVTDIHFCEVFVVSHLIVWDLHALLEGDSVVVVAGSNRWGNTRVGSISSNDNIDFKSFFLTLVLSVDIVDIVNNT